MQPTIALLFAFIAATVASPAAYESNPFIKRTSCGPKGCKAKGGTNYCLQTLGCDGGCESGSDRCGGPPACNTHFNNCKRSIEYDIALQAGKIVEREDGVVERRADDVEEYVAAVLEAMREL